MRQECRGRILTGLVVCVVMAACAQAEVITIAIEARVDAVTDTANVFGGAIQAGHTITGYYAYESTTPDTNPSSTYGAYWQTHVGCAISFTIAGFGFSTDGNEMNWRVGIENDYHDTYSIRSYNNLPLSDGTPVESIYWQLEDSTGMALTNTDLPTTAPVLTDWDYNRLILETSRTFSIDAHVTKGEVVPEPSTMLLIVVGAFVIRRRLT